MLLYFSVIEQWFFVGEIQYAVTAERVARWHYAARVECIDTVVIFIILTVCVAEKSDVNIHIQQAFRSGNSPIFT